MADEPRVVAFGAVEWEEEAPGIKARADQLLGQRWAIVEYEKGAWREEWCTDGHRGLVLEGEIQYEFDDGTAPLTAKQGEAFRLPGGSGHRGHNLADQATQLFLIDDPT